MLERLSSLVAIALLSALVAACSILGWEYSYSGRKYTMSQDHIDYHREVMADYERKTNSAKRAGKSEANILTMQCKLLERGLSGAPKSSNFTSATQLLQKDRDSICPQAQQARSSASGIGGPCPEGTHVMRKPDHEYCADSNQFPNGWYIAWHGKRRIKKRTGNPATDLYYPPEGLVKREAGQIVGGKRGGEWTFWYASGKKKAQGRYDSGNKVGTWNYWREDGTPLTPQELFQLATDLLANNGREKALELAETCYGYWPENGKCQSILAQATCDADDLSGCYVAASKLRQSDVRGFLAIHETLCRNFQASSCEALAIFFKIGSGPAKYNNGVEIPANASKSKSLYKKAMTYYKSACDLGDGASCDGLANGYASGNGVSKNLPKAKMYFRKGCELNHWASCRSYSTRFNYDDPVGAFAMLTKACENGDELACKDRVYQLNESKQLCKQGNKDACFYLGLTVEDKSKARTYLKRSCDLGHSGACSEL